MIELTPEQRERMLLWVRALRSGEFRQGQGALVSFGHEGLAYCCLGVLCEVALANGLEMKAERPTVIGTVGKYDDSSSFIPKKVQEWMGIHDGDVELTYQRKTTAAVTLNDSMEATFDQIADAIVETFGPDKSETEVGDDATGTD
jgi:hypothetical protein